MTGPYFYGVTMNAAEILDFVNQTVTCNIATCDGTQPHTRGIMTYHADKDGIIFHTSARKDFFKQLQKNPSVELCFFRDNIQVRITGTARLLNDQKLKEEIVSKRAFLQPMVEKMGYDFLSVFRVENMTATVWTMATNLQPAEFIKL